LPSIKILYLHLHTTQTDSLDTANGPCMRWKLGGCLQRWREVCCCQRPCTSQRANDHIYTWARNENSSPLMLQASHISLHVVVE
jgi:hypothetical protein